MTEMSPVPEGSLLLHIGPQKTGSTAIQHALHHVRPALADHGVHYVGNRPREKEAGWVALGLGAPIGRRPPQPQTWQRVVEEIRTATMPRLCLSNEEFARADDAAITKILDATGVERTHLVYVARGLDKVLPSHWQQQVKARLTESYADFLRRVLAPTAVGWMYEVVMAPQDVGAVLARWGKHLPQEHMTVIVADDDDRTALLRAFELLLGLPPGLIEPPSGPANRSMGLLETQAMRQVNQVTLDEAWDAGEYRNLVQLGIVGALKARPPTGERIGGIPEFAMARVCELADAQVDAIRSSGAQVLGDPERLRVRNRVAPDPLSAEIDSVDPELVSDIVRGLRDGSLRMRPPTQAAAVLDARDDLGGRQLLQLLARRTAARLGVRSR